MVNVYLFQQGGGDVIFLSVTLSFVSSPVNRITDECGNGCRPNLAGMEKG